MPTNQGFNFVFTSPSTGYYNDAVGGLYKSMDTGNSWKPIYQGSLMNMGYYSYFFNSDWGYTIDGYGDVFKTTNGGFTWQQLSSNLVPTYNPINPSSYPSFNVL